ncbi:hypothetical protein Phep_2307 [Pedobacter heparinus DSM 2366]|uniref:Uncharacterized protein n=1 Tax=Pedobacter heparinus (strain ATCC 13125 / DSM 2366 / CIP 104194 / JCM 7457 / NBRC 12017 / NCIMB 9290 / NRRL B-14731 / HIM 762-3) TaxID=485917 RepID=C6XYM9_PEDHD|nr:hypothetical protein Phep_2307 [Pedobacter heparinus DSM 2366]
MYEAKIEDTYAVHEEWVARFAGGIYLPNALCNSKMQANR